MAEAGIFSTRTLQLATLPSGDTVTTRAHVYDGSSAGPSLYVQAAQHGNEVNGVEVLRRLHGWLDVEALAGELVAVPVANPITFDLRSYTTPRAIDGDQPNINRLWPGDAGGSVQARIAAKLWDLASNADAIVDLHGGGPRMLTHVAFAGDHEPSRELARAFGTRLMIAEAADAVGLLHRVAARRGVPSLIAELSDSRWIDEDAVHTGLVGVSNVLRHLDMVSEPVEEAERPVLVSDDAIRVEATEPGLFIREPSVNIGDGLESGAVLGAIYDPQSYEVRQEVVAREGGIVYVYAPGGPVTPGDRIADIAPTLSG